MVLETKQAAEFSQWISQNDHPVLVDFWAEWCVYCRRLAPALEAVAAEYEGRLTVVKVNVDEAPAIAQEADITVLPTLVLYRNGQALDSVVAPQSKAELSRFVAPHLP